MIALKLVYNNKYEFNSKKPVSLPVNCNCNCNSALFYGFISKFPFQFFKLFIPLYGFKSDGKVKKQNTPSPNKQTLHEPRHQARGCYSIRHSPTSAMLARRAITGAEASWHVNVGLGEPAILVLPL